MKLFRSIAVVSFVLAGSVAARAQQYTAQHANDVVRLEDATHQIVVSIIPSVGNIAFEMKVKGHDVLRWPYASVDDFKAKPGMSALPFVGPWMGRLDEQAFYASGKRYAFDMESGTVRGAVPIHGFLTTTNQWQLIEAKADGRSAWATSRLDFYRQPQWMKQWPFAHTIEITHRLQDGVLAVETRLHNLSVDPMPVAVGYHPYFKLTDSTREEWTLSLPAKTLWTFKQGTKLPDGVTVPAEQLFPNPASIALRDYDLDDGLTDFVRDGDGRAHFIVKGKQQQLDIMFGGNWSVINVWSPNPAGTGRGGNRVVTSNAPPAGRGGGTADPNFIALEPMASLSNGLNLAQKGRYTQQYVQPGATWSATFWVKPSGF
jgi:aldose 1-epimerase